MNVSQECLLAMALFTPATSAIAKEPEGSLPAARVLPGATVLTHTARRGEVLSGFSLRLANCIGPREEPITAALRVRGKLLADRVAIPAFAFPLVEHTRPHGPALPLDVGQEYRQAIEPTRLRAGDQVQVEILSTKPVKSGVVATLQFQGRHPLAAMRNPFRESRLAGPVCRIPWQRAEVIAVGTQVKFDPLCAPQNNASIVADDDGTLFQFTAYYSVDEQYGGGRGGSYSRVFGYRKGPKATGWEPLGVVAELHPGKTYSGDPFAFRDLEGTPCLVYTVADGTDGFADWRRIDAFVIRSTTKSFSGPWGVPHALFEGYPRDPDDNRTGGRANCIRIYPREKSHDYLLVWTHGAQDMDIRGLLLPDLAGAITHEQIGNAPVLVRNQDEGGGGFQHGSKGYLSTWQIPWVNDPTGVQRLYEIDLSHPLDPEAWRVVPGSIGMNDGADARRDGGCTADSWAVSAIGDELWATSCEWSVTEQRNALMAHRAPIRGKGPLPSDGDRFRYGTVRVPGFHEVVPVVEYAVGTECALELTFSSVGKEAYGFLLLGPSTQPLFHHSVGLEVSSAGSRLVAYADDATPIPLTGYASPTWEPGKSYRMRLARHGNRLSGWVDGVPVGQVEVASPTILAALQDPQRFKLYGWQGGSYTVSGAVLVDGPGR